VIVNTVKNMIPVMDNKNILFQPHHLGLKNNKFINIKTGVVGDRSYKYFIKDVIDLEYNIHTNTSFIENVFKQMVPEQDYSKFKQLIGSLLMPHPDRKYVFILTGNRTSIDLFIILFRISFPHLCEDVNCIELTKALGKNTLEKIKDKRLIIFDLCNDITICDKVLTTYVNKGPIASASKNYIYLNCNFIVTSSKIPRIDGTFSNSVYSLNVQNYVYGDISQIDTDEIGSKQQLLTMFSMFCINCANYVCNNRFEEPNPVMCFKKDIKVIVHGDKRPYSDHFNDFIGRRGYFITENNFHQNVVESKLWI
jgi:hypothetical protein